MSENDRQNVTDLFPEKKEKVRRKTRRKKAAATAILLALLLLSAFALWYSGAVSLAAREAKLLLNGEPVVFSLKPGKATDGFGFGLISADSDGIRVYAADGTLRGEAAVTMAKPVICSGKRFCAVYDLGGTAFRLIDSVGASRLTLQTKGVLLDADVSVSGSCAVLEQRDDCKSVLTVYDDRQNPIYTWFSETRCFSEIAVSEHGKAFCGIALEGSESKAVLFRTDEELPTAELSLGNQRILALCCVDRDTLCAIGEDSTFFFRQDGELLGSYAYDGAVLTEYSVRGDGFAALILNKNQARDFCRLVFLDGSGACIAERRIEDKILSIDTAKDRCAILTAERAYFYDSTMNELAQFAVDNCTEQLFLLDGGAAALTGNGICSLYLLP